MTKINRRAGYTIIEVMVVIVFVMATLLAFSGLAVLVHFIAKFW